MESVWNVWNVWKVNAVSKTFQTYKNVKLCKSDVWRFGKSNTKNTTKSNFL